MIRRLHRTSRRRLEERIEELLEHNRVQAQQIKRFLDALELEDGRTAARILSHVHGEPPS